MPLNDRQIKNAKPAETGKKAKLFDGGCLYLESYPRRRQNLSPEIPHSPCGGRPHQGGIPWNRLHERTARNKVV